jgi:hypothetical protein
MANIGVLAQRDVVDDAGFTSKVSLAWSPSRWMLRLDSADAAAELHCSFDGTVVCAILKIGSPVDRIDIDTTHRQLWVKKVGGAAAAVALVTTVFE